MSEAASFGAAHIARGIGRMSTHVLAKGQGSYLTTDTGKHLLDLTSGIGVVNLGHCHPRITAAAQEQVGTLVHAQVNIGFSLQQIELIKKVLRHVPDRSLDSVLFWNSGSEAVEASVKLARAATGRQNIIVMQGSYHGRTMGTMAMTKSKTIYSTGFAPLMPGVFVTPFPYYSQLGVAPNTPTDKMVSLCLHQLRLLLAQQTAPSDTAAIILEPVLGEGGYVPAPKAFLEGLRSVCDQHNILLIADEVQSGYGRTGKMWAIEHSGVRPDILISAKGLANGFPLSMVVSRKELMDKQGPGSMGGTYAGNAVSCAAANAVIDTFEQDKILDNVAARSKQMFDFLHQLQQSGSKAGKYIQDIRGLGLMVGLQFSQDQGASSSSLPAASSDSTAALYLFEVDGTKHAQLAPQVVQECLKRDMLLLSTSTQDVIRFIPPLTITEEELAQACKIFKESLEAVVSRL
ncbi:hypothetical protein K437DRAFT_223842 [Tilletiaria anomala UBC 951]|uniref:4-aminobutyrate aminotransferase n=1 Tax=Tilletiaria anomala (strain ATCC 24038 / CBS 436.72 / UBC 951) TaxID=1037660 RepID=A0A066W0N1_TILAU|nr:uncharacterized protein K437DRAFT_223842 [Tilletiaria anomala UBC 951]KDN46108.1 hypothetical protein K437DRAFT_223842 [Tilletiaria anomala UBC 951]